MCRPTDAAITRSNHKIELAVKPNENVVKPNASLVRSHENLAKPNESPVRPNDSLVKPNASLVRPNENLVRPNENVVRPTSVWLSLAHRKRRDPFFGNDERGAIRLPRFVRNRPR